MIKKVIIFGTVFWMLFLSSCGVLEKQEKAVVQGNVFRDSLLQQPLEGVLVRIRIDNAQNVPDEFTTSDKNGFFQKSFYLGHTYDEEKGFSMVTNALIQVKLTYENKYYIYQDYYLGPGDTLKLPDVYLALFQGE